jgi:hypothetical protein
MRDPHSPSVGGAPFSMLLVSLRYVALAALLSSCSANLPVQREAQQAEDGVRPAPFSIVCVIHGDGDYLYHDTSGIEYTADEEALAGAQSIARHNPEAEVFIFHQRPRRHLLFFFPRHDGEFYYYRNGQLIANELYWRDQERSPFDAEVELYRRFREDNQRRMVSIFFYCGHEIPEFGGAGYDASYPDRPFTIHDLAGALEGFTRDSTRFDLMLLSTCFGGTPYTIGALGSFARYIIASPDNLHLSYFVLQPLERLDLSLEDGDVHAFAERFAQRSFDRLTSSIQTAVSVAVYDVDRVKEYLRTVHGTYDQTLSTLKGAVEAPEIAMEHCDCADLPAYAMPAMNEGVDVFYRPARFGRSKHKQTHSGWECWRRDDNPVLKEMHQQ